MKPVRDELPMVLFGARLRELRRQQKMTQQRVADHLQVDRTTYTKYESGRVSPDHQALVRLAELFGVTVDSLLGREETADIAVAHEEGAQMLLSLQEQRLVQMFRQLPQEEQRILADKVDKVFRDRRQ